MTYSFLNITLNNDNSVENWTSDLIVEQYSTDTIIRLAYKNIDPNHYAYIVFEYNGVRKIMKPTVEFAMKNVVGKTYAYHLTQYETQYYTSTKKFSIILQNRAGDIIATKEFSFKMKKMPYAVFENLDLNKDSSLLGVAKGVEDNARDIANITKLIGGLTISDAQADWNETDTDSRKYIQNKPTKVSAFENDSKYLKETDIDLTKYYDKTTTDSKIKTAVDSAVNALPNTYYDKAGTNAQIKSAIDKLPETYYTEAEVDSKLATRYTKSEVDNKLASKVDTEDIADLVNTTTLTNYYTKQEAEAKFVDNMVNDLVNYYTKSNTYSRSEINNIISTIPKFTIKVVQSLPTSDISSNALYLLLRSEGAEQNDYYDEYIYVGGEWEHIGSTKVNLSNYYTKAEIDKLLKDISGGTFEGYYTKEEINTLLASKVSTATLNDYYTSTVTDTLLAKKANSDDLLNYYNKTDTDNLFKKYYTIDQTNSKLADYYTKQQIDSTLTGYYTNSQVDEKLDNKYDKSAVDSKLEGYYTKVESDLKYYDKETVDSKIASIDIPDTKIVSVTSTATYSSGEIKFPVTVDFTDGVWYTFTVTLTTSATMDDSYIIYALDKNGARVDIQNYKNDVTTFADFKQILKQTNSTTYRWRFTAYCKDITVNSIAKKVLITDTVVDVTGNTITLPDWIGPTKPSYTAEEVGAYAKSQVDQKFSEEVESRNAAINLAVDNLVNGAPGTMDTLKEISDAIEKHRDVTDALNAAIGNKVDKETGKGLSSNDYTSAEKSKLAGIEAGAQVNFTKLSQLSDDVGYATETYVNTHGGKIDSISLNGVTLDIVDKSVQITEQDPTVPDWAKSSTKPTYTAEEVGAYTKGQIDETTSALTSRITALENVEIPEPKIDNIGVKTASGGEYTNIPVVNKQAQLDLSGYLTEHQSLADYATKTELNTQKTDLETAISNTETTLRGEITQAASNANSYTDTKVSRENLVSTIGNASTTLEGLLTSEDKRRLDALYAVLGETTDEDSFVNTINEILAIFNNYPEGVDLVSALNGKLNVSDVVNNLTSEETSKPLSAKQGKVLSGAIATEEERATGRENEVEAKITTETNRATGVEATLQSSINTLSSEITTEKDRAIARENEIEAKSANIKFRVWG